MAADDQHATIEFLRDPATHEGVGEVETIETHISMIFLAGDRVFKLKRAVELPYADFSTPDLRLETCEKEVRLNALTAPELYRGARRITREADGGLAFDGTGELVDAVVEMARFDQEALFDRMAAKGKLTPAMMTELAGAIVDFHARAPDDRGTGGADNMRAVLDINEAAFATSRVFDAEEVADFNARFRKAVDRHAERLDARGTRGRVRRCHGDLHLRNICLLDGRPRLFDCIEFNDRIATVDVLYDLAFLLMDLWHSDLDGHANLVANRYLDLTDDEDGFALLPFFMAVRAAVRAHVTATQIAEGGAEDDDLVATARAYFDLANALLEPVQPCFVAIGGLSGSGKSTVAEALASHVGAPPGARIVESDRVRKAMFGVSPETRLEADAYAPEVSERVYRALGERARAVLADGGSVVADAVFDRPDHRNAIEAAGAGLGVPFTGIWLAADATTLRRRVGTRGKGPSDADLGVLDRQLENAPGAIRWQRVDADRPVDDVVAAILSRL